ncbi:hypothetical protein LG204_06465 [Methylovorus menthalis]|uniref:hypothetical protein n=1 Tax=Methylovorus menthalis TaxID=1002227 RepID=UPI001E54E888|nr:hypothetical protein [Methylovorus menthalis]MCB4810955.1 hypothetical protein [Methylovorus menthalis]
MRIESQSKQAAILHLDDGRQLALRVEPHTVVFAWGRQVIIRLHFRTLRSANSPEETPLFSLESAEASLEWKAQLAPWLAPALELFSQYHGGRVIIAKSLSIDLNLPA